MIQVEGFNVRIVDGGMGYGKNDCLILANWEDPLVEFYDAKQDREKFGPRGQFVSRYYLHTLAAGDYPKGLALDGENYKWSISPAGMRAVKHYLNGYLQSQS